MTTDAVTSTTPRTTHAAEDGRTAVRHDRTHGVGTVAGSCSPASSTVAVPRSCVSATRISATTTTPPAAESETLVTPHGEAAIPMPIPVNVTTLKARLT